MFTGRRALLLAPFVFFLALVVHAAPNDEAPTSAIEGQVLLKMASERVVGSTLTDALIRTYMAHEGLRDITIQRSSDLNKATYTGLAGRCSIPHGCVSNWSSAASALRPSSRRIAGRIS